MSSIHRRIISVVITKLLSWHERFAIVELADRRHARIEIPVICAAKLPNPANGFATPEMPTVSDRIRGLSERIIGLHAILRRQGPRLMVVNIRKNPREIIDLRVDDYLDLHARVSRGMALDRDDRDLLEAMIRSREPGVIAAAHRIHDMVHTVSEQRRGGIRVGDVLRAALAA